eukprot:365176-Chlamydomonas_euryale.AAC.6
MHARCCMRCHAHPDCNHMQPPPCMLAVACAAAPNQTAAACTHCQACSLSHALPRPTRPQPHAPTSMHARCRMRCHAHPDCSRMYPLPGMLAVACAAAPAQTTAACTHY